MPTMEILDREAILNELRLASRPRIPKLSPLQRSLLQELSCTGDITQPELVKAMRERHDLSRMARYPKRLHRALGWLLWNRATLGLQLRLLQDAKLVATRNTATATTYRNTKIGQRAAL